jgi:hypothetical protein
MSELAWPGGLLLQPKLLSLKDFLEGVRLAPLSLFSLGTARRRAVFREEAGMRSRASVFFALAVGLAGVVLAGCGSALQPRPLTAAQRAQVQRFRGGESGGGAESLGVVAVEAPDEGYARILASMLERTEVFRSVLLVTSSGPAPQGVDYVATLTGRCNARHGGWIPWLPILTLGVVPQFHTFEVGLPFTLRRIATHEEVAIPCEIRSTVAVGWIPALLNVLPGWSLEEPEQTSTFNRRLAYAIVSRTVTRPPL